MNQRYVIIYIQKLAGALIKYGELLVFNMDETSIRINSGSTRSLVPLRTQDVVVDARRNSKECFTAIGTCTDAFNLINKRKD